MVSKAQLAQLENRSLQGAESAALTDILKVTITGATPEERLERYLDQVRNPYHFLVGDRPVRLVFLQGERDLESKLKSYFISLKRDSDPPRSSSSREKR